MTDDVQAPVQAAPMIQAEPDPLPPASSVSESTQTSFVRPITAEAEARRDLNDVVHKVLVIGLLLSTVILVFGVLLGLVEHRPLPDTTLSVGEAVSRAVGLRPSGFLNLGLLVLIVTPILRVIGSIFVFIHERDWRYAGITALVLAVMLFSLLSGHGG
ncbi:MAG: DUF1634 domain-containing protein [Anaerolineae bacterium]|nr:DUF1634 domain-containing protein [Anaerolineae bacterium]